MSINQYKLHKYLSLNSLESDNNRFNIQNLSLSNKSKIALVGVNSSNINSNLNFIYCPSIRNNNYQSSLNTPPLIYAGIGYENKNVINGKQFYEINGANLNEIELKTFSSPPQNDFSYPELVGLKPNLWYKFDTDAITTNDGTDAITLTNYNSTPNAGVSVRGNNSASFNGTNQYLSGTINGIANNSFSISVWLYIKSISISRFILSFGNPTANYQYIGFQIKNSSDNVLYSFDFYGNDSITNSSYNDVNNWVFLTYTFNSLTKEKSIYRNGIKLIISNNIASNNFIGNNKIIIGVYEASTNWYNGYMDDLRIYTGTVLTQDQINAIYNNTRINYPIIKNETLKIANPADNDPNIHTIPNVWCRFDTGALTTNNGTDSITLTNNGATNAGVSVRGNNSASFNGSTQYLNGTITGIANNSFSVSAWLYSTTGAVGKGIFLNFGNIAGANQTLWLGFGVITTANTYWFGFSFNDANSTTTFPQDINNWAHLTFVYNSLTRERMIYRNGVKLELTNAISSSQPIPNNTFKIGTFFENAYWYQGYMDDLRIYTGKVLDQEEITRIYNGTKTDYTTTITEPTIGMDLTPNLWCKFDTGALTTNDGIDAITISNSLSVNAGFFVRGNNSASFNGTNQYMAGYINGIANNSFSFSIWSYIKTAGNHTLINLGDNNQTLNNILTMRTYTSGSNLKYALNFWANDCISVLDFNDVNTWVYLTFTYNNQTKERSIYRNGVKLNTTGAISTSGDYKGSSLIFIGIFVSAINLLNGYLDDLRVYTGTVLSQAQITEIYAGNPYYNLPTINNKYSTINETNNYQFEIQDTNQNLINRY